MYNITHICVLQRGELDWLKSTFLQKGRSLTHGLYNLKLFFVVHVTFFSILRLFFFLSFLVLFVDCRVFHVLMIFFSYQNNKNVHHISSDSDYYILIKRKKKYWNAFWRYIYLIYSVKIVWWHLSVFNLHALYILLNITIRI